MRAVVARQGIATAARHGVTPLEGLSIICRALPASNYAAPRVMSCLGRCGSAQPNTMSAHISRGGYRLVGLAPKRARGVPPNPSSHRTACGGR